MTIPFHGIRHTPNGHMTDEYRDYLNKTSGDQIEIPPHGVVMTIYDDQCYLVESVDTGDYVSRLLVIVNTLRRGKWYSNSIDGTAPHFICPDCSMVSYSAEDVEHKYCDNCHEFKGDLHSVR